jgi:hypothetical protein
MAATGLLGVVAGSASAHEFVTSKYRRIPSESTPIRTSGKNIEPSTYGTSGFQTFTFGDYRIGCERVLSKGEVTESPAPGLETTLTYSHCGYYPIVGGEEHIPAQVLGGFKVDFLADGAANTIGNPELEEEEYLHPVAELRETSVKLRIPAGKFCEINVAAQTLDYGPKGEYTDALYTDSEVPITNPTPGRLKLFPGGFQHKITIAIDFKSVKVKFAPETQCGEDEKATEREGTIKGTVIEEAPGGNIEWK